MILYVGSCFPSADTALKKWGLGVMGDCEVGNRPWLSEKETGVVVYKPLRNMRERANEGRVRMVRIMWRVIAACCLDEPHKGRPGPADRRGHMIYTIEVNLLAGSHRVFVLHGLQVPSGIYHLSEILDPDENAHT